MTETIHRREQTSVWTVQKRGRFRWACTWVVVAALVGGALTACGSDDKGKSASSAPASETATTKHVTVAGWAYAGQPLKGAELSVTTTDGKTVVRPQPNATNENGAFAIPANLPPNYRVTVSGGTVGEAVFTGKLVADVVDYGATSGSINVNGITTLLAAYRDRHLDQSPAQVQDAVRRFLQLPNSADLSGDFRSSPDLFSNAEFQTQAEANGGVQPFVNQLAVAMDTPGNTQAFVGPAENDITTDGMKTAAKAIAKLGMEEALKQFGFQSPDKVVADALSKISGQLNDVQNAINDLKADVKKAIFKGDAAQIIPMKDTIVNAFNNLNDYATASEPKSDYAKSQLKDARTAINRLAVNPPAQLTLHHLLNGDINADGAYKDLSEALKADGTFWTPEKSLQLRSFFEYFDSIQSELALMLADRVKQNGGSDTDLETPNGVLTQYTANRTAQLAREPSVAPTVIDTRSNLMWPISNDRADNTWWVRYDAVDGFNGCATINGLRICNAKLFPPKFGFQDWRVPSREQLEALVANQANPKDWLQKGELGIGCVQAKDRERDRPRVDGHGRSQPEPQEQLRHGHDHGEGDVAQERRPRGGAARARREREVLAVEVQTVKAAARTPLVVLAAMLLLIGCSSPSGSGDASTGPLKIGVMMPLTGPDARDYKTPLDWAVENVNNAGGAGGHKLELDYADLGTVSVADATRRFAGDPSIVAVIGPNSSDRVFAVAPALIEAGKTIVSPTATSGDIFRAFSSSGYMWRTVQSDIAQVRTALVAAGA